MSEKLDNDLKRRVSEVFDNYEDPTAEEGWMLLREKFPATAKHRGTAWLWWASAAAVFLLFIGVGVWLTTDKIDTTQRLVENKPAAKTTLPAKDNITTTPEAHETATQNNPDQALADNHGSSIKKSPVIINFGPPVPKVNSETIVVKTQPAVTAETTESLIASISNVPPAVKAKDTAATVAPKAVEAYATVKQTTVVKPAEKKPGIQTPEKGTMESLFAQEAMANANNKAKDKTNKEKAVHFGVFAGTYMNYATGSDNQVNVGAGFSSDFRISKNLKLSTGISIAQNSFNYAGNNNLPQEAASASLVAQAVQNNDKGFSASGSSPELNNYNARLTGLDVPINIKYEFNPEKSDTYISAGLSSGTFINESYTYRYNYPALFAGGEKDATQPQQQVDEKITDSFNGFYFGRTLNVAFGVGYPLGKHNRLIIEPFMKYPLSGLGAQQIKFGSGGINLKLNFQTRKK